MEETPGNPQRLLTLTEVCGLLRMSRSTVWRLVKSGELAVVYLDRMPRFTRADVEDLIRRRRSGGPG